LIVDFMVEGKTNTLNSERRQDSQKDCQCNCSFDIHVAIGTTMNRWNFSKGRLTFKVQNTDIM